MSTRDRRKLITIVLQRPVSLKRYDEEFNSSRFCFFLNCITISMTHMIRQTKPLAHFSAPLLLDLEVLFLFSEIKE